MSVLNEVLILSGSRLMTMHLHFDQGFMFIIYKHPLVSLYKGCKFCCFTD